MVATAIVGSAAIGAGGTALASSQNASATTKAANQNNALLQNEFNTTRSDLSPSRDLGANASDTLYNALAGFEQPVQMSEAQLQQTPGYQFNLQQGLKGVQNSAAARGLAGSGAALKVAATDALCLADST